MTWEAVAADFTNLVFGAQFMHLVLDLIQVLAGEAEPPGVSVLYIHYSQRKLAEIELSHEHALDTGGASDAAGRYECNHSRSREELLWLSEVCIDGFSLSSVRCAEEFMETRYEHIVLNEDHVPRIAGTTMKVVELVVEQQAYGWSPEELHFQHPYLALG